MQRIEPRQTVFREAQRFRQVWIWLIVVGIAGLMWYAAAQRLILGKQVGSHPMPDPVLAVSWMLFGIVLPWAILSSRLVTEVREDGVYFRFSPYHRSFRRVPFSDLQHYGSVAYSPLRDYGGWGIRYGLNGPAYITGGNRGVELVLSSGKRLLLGSQNPSRLVEAIASVEREGLE